MLTQVDLVHVQLEDLVLRERPLDLQRQQRLGELARIRLLAAQEEVARHLLRDRRRAFAPVMHQVREERARDALDADAAVGAEIGVLCGDQRVLQHIRELAHRHEAAPLGAELRQLDAFAGDDLQRLARLVVGDLVELGQLLGDDDDGDDQRCEERRDDESADPRNGQPRVPGNQLEHSAGRGRGNWGKTQTLRHADRRAGLAAGSSSSYMKSIIRVPRRVRAARRTGSGTAIHENQGFLLNHILMHCTIAQWSTSVKIQS